MIPSETYQHIQTLRHDGRGREALLHQLTPWTPPAQAFDFAAKVAENAPRAAKRRSLWQIIKVILKAHGIKALREVLEAFLDYLESRTAEEE